MLSVLVNKSTSNRFLYIRQGLLFYAPSEPDCSWCGDINFKWKKKKKRKKKRTKIKLPRCLQRKFKQPLASKYSYLRLSTLPPCEYRRHSSLAEVSSFLTLTSAKSPDLKENRKTAPAKRRDYIYVVIPW